MKLSYQWLGEYVALRLEPRALAQRLTLAGIEIGGIEPVAPPLDDVVVGRVRSVSAHPNAPALKVCDVEAGRGEIVRVVCGAPNVATGINAPLALVGASLPGGRRIDTVDIQGVESAGMLCSSAELGLDTDAAGLLVLDPSARVGAPLAQALALDDVILDVELTPNRGDCLSVIGLARETAAVTGARLKAARVPKNRVRTRARVAVAIAAKKDCPRYAGRVVRGLNPRATTPAWMRERLRRGGVRSLHPVVDVTNYVMLELGQPMHAFDLAKLRGSIRVRTAAGTESLTLLDGRDLVAPAGSLLITDDRGAIALAGIMGGEDTAVGTDTDAVFFESAYFAPETIARHARALGLQTESSYRFERGVDPASQVRALERATALLIDIAGGEAGPVVEAGGSGRPAAPILLRGPRLARVIGRTIAPAQVKRALAALSMKVTPARDGWRVTPPPYRFDVRIEEDLIEEVARVVGYDRVPTRLPTAALGAPEVPEARLTRGRVRAALVDRDYQEVITYSFVDPALLRLLDPDTPALELANPISTDMVAMRTTLWPGLLQVLQYNRNRQQQRVRVFEIGRRFRADGSGGHDEEFVLAGAATGFADGEQWGAPKRTVDFYDIKGDLETLIGATARPEAFDFRSAAHAALHSGQTAAIHLEGERIGWLGAVHPGVQVKLGLSDVVLFELRLDALTERKIPAYREISRFPAIRRDLAIVVSDQVAAAAVLACVKKAAGKLLVDLQLFDVYRGEGIDSGRKSLALGLTLQDSSRTLREAEVDTLMTQVVTTLRGEVGGELRR